MRVKNLFGEYEDLNLAKTKSKIVVNKIEPTEDKVPQDILQKIYAQPDKKYYSISEVSRLFDVNSSLLRYWEQKFGQIQPSRSANGTRRYTKKDIEAINTIHYYLKNKKWTIKGVKEHLKTDKSETKSILVSQLQNIKKKLLDINKRLESAKQS